MYKYYCHLCCSKIMDNLIMSEVSSTTVCDDETYDNTYFSLSNHSNKTLNKISEYFQQKFLCDILLICGNKRIEAHRIVISSMSDYFYAMFSSNMLETKQKEVIINDIDPDALEKLINYAYDGKIDFKFDSVTSILSAASMLNISEIVEACCNYIIKQLHASNCLGIFRFAEHHSLKNLCKVSYNFITEHFSAVIKNHEFLELTADELKKLLESDDLNVHSEEIIFEAFLSWLQYDKEKRQNENLAQLLGSIKLPLIKPLYLTDHIDSNPLFKENTQCQALIIEAMRYHLIPERRSIMQTIRTKPRRSTIGSLYCLGGMDTTKGPQTIEKYCFRTRFWHPDGHLNSRRLQFASVLLDKKLFVVGGRDGLKTLNSVEYYDLQKKQWHVSPPMLTNRHGLGVEQLGGPFYAVGGHDGWSFLNTVERFDPQTRIWTYVSSMSNARCTLGVGVFENRLYAVGGRDGSSSGLRSVECYDPHTNKWLQCASMQKRRSGVGVAVCNDFIFAIGGHSDSSANNKNATRHDDGERYDPRCDQWTIIASFSRPKEAIAVATLGNKIFAVGGFNGEKVVDEVEKYDTDKNTWTKCVSLHTRRAGACLLHIPNSVYQPVLSSSSYSLNSLCQKIKDPDISSSCHQLSRLTLS